MNSSTDIIKTSGLLKRRGNLQQIPIPLHACYNFENVCNCQIIWSCFDISQQAVSFELFDCTIEYQFVLSLSSSLSTIYKRSSVRHLLNKVLGHLTENQVSMLSLKMPGLSSYISRKGISTNKAVCLFTITLQISVPYSIARRLQTELCHTIFYDCFRAHYTFKFYLLLWYFRPCSPIHWSLFTTTFR